MNISPATVLILGIVAGSLFLLVFVAALILTLRNRRTLAKCRNTNNKD